MSARYHAAEIAQQLSQLGAGAGHVSRIMRAWLQGQPLGQGRTAPEHSLPLSVRQALPDLEADLAGLVRVISAHPGSDGSERLLLALEGGQTIESVMLPRNGQCVSTQVGCAVGCRFCMTGKDGLQRQLGSAEILAQVALGRQRRPVQKVVFMGMGEPSHNLEAVLDAIHYLGTLGGIGHKNLVFSTVGDPRVFERLPQQQVKPALALSLHTGNRTLRRELLPRAIDLDPWELVAWGEDYARLTRYPIQYQWTLLQGVNDRDEDVDTIAAMLKGKYGMMNLIPYNQNEGLGYHRPDLDRAVEMTRQLNRRGILTRLRHSAGQEVDGGCGQLRARATAQNQIGQTSKVFLRKSPKIA